MNKSDDFKFLYKCPICKKVTILGYHDSTLCVIEQSLLKSLEKRKSRNVD